MTPIDTRRTSKEMSAVIDSLSLGQFYVEQSGIDVNETNLLWFSLSTGDVLHFTPYDSDKTLRLGLLNHGLIRD